MAPPDPTSDILAALTALEQLSSSISTSSSGPLNALIDQHFSIARDRIVAGSPPKQVIAELQSAVTRSKKDVEKGLKAWYTALNKVGSAIEGSFPPNLGMIAAAYSDPPLFETDEARDALDRVVMGSMGRRGLWTAVGEMEEETGLRYDEGMRILAEELGGIVGDIERGDVAAAIRWVAILLHFSCDVESTEMLTSSWCEANATYLDSPPHPSPLPYHLHRYVFLQFTNPSDAIAYAQAHLLTYVPTQDVLALITSCLYRAPKATNGHLNGHSSSESAATGVPTLSGPPAMSNKSPYRLTSPSLVELIRMFRAEFCRRHGWPKEEPLEVVADLGGRGGALNAIEKARRVMGDRLGNVRKWEELPVSLNLLETPP